eukprot:scaffold10969_cov36-Attheya_sp.AAC.4
MSSVAIAEDDDQAAPLVRLPGRTIQFHYEFTDERLRTLLRQDYCWDTDVIQTYHLDKDPGIIIDPVVDDGVVPTSPDGRSVMDRLKGRVGKLQDALMPIDRIICVVQIGNNSNKQYVVLDASAIDRRVVFYNHGSRDRTVALSDVLPFAQTLLEAFGITGGELVFHRTRGNALS